MDRPELHREINQLTESDAERCLQVILRGFAVRNGYEELLASPEQLQEVLRRYNELVMAHKQKEIPSQPPALEEPEKRTQAVREMLHLIADDEELHRNIDSWFASGRPTLVEPITAAIVLAGIVFVLSTDLKIKVRRNPDGKKAWDVDLKKEPTKDSIIAKFFSMFSARHGQSTQE